MARPKAPRRPPKVYGTATKVCGEDVDHYGDRHPPRPEESPDPGPREDPDNDLHEVRPTRRNLLTTGATTTATPLAPAAPAHESATDPDVTARLHALETHHGARVAVCAITRFARSVGDRATRLDRWETELTSAGP
ncbi:hypothetical protein ACW4TU_31265 [Streptomyces sp. QTS52]